ncbi:hypothetical protein NEIRO03_0248 [Nematocida sp. AWRm78]|nr:hypothetical protein NEIRO02_0249 [Nematocida sp. AWRm79]KAI5182584.1 hypothetical protein NEIRO03_0248 [Nematocida sp. AWRm78]
MAISTGRSTRTILLLIGGTIAIGCVVAIIAFLFSTPSTESIKKKEAPKVPSNSNTMDIKISEHKKPTTDNNLESDSSTEIETIDYLYNNSTIYSELYSSSSSSSESNNIPPKPIILHNTAINTKTRVDSISIPDEYIACKYQRAMPITESSSESSSESSIAQQKSPQKRTSNLDSEDELISLKKVKLSYSGDTSKEIPPQKTNPVIQPENNPAIVMESKSLSDLDTTLPVIKKTKSLPNIKITVPNTNKPNPPLNLTDTTLPVIKKTNSLPDLDTTLPKSTTNLSLESINTQVSEKISELSSISSRDLEQNTTPSLSDTGSLLRIINKYSQQNIESLTETTNEPFIPLIDGNASPIQQNNSYNLAGSSTQSLHSFASTQEGLNSPSMVKNIIQSGFMNNQPLNQNTVESNSEVSTNTSNAILNIQKVNYSFDPTIYLNLKYSYDTLYNRLCNAFYSINDKNDFWGLIKKIGSNIQERTILVDDILTCYRMDFNNFKMLFDNLFQDSSIDIYLFLELQQFITKFGPKMYMDEKDLKQIGLYLNNEFTVGDIIESKNKYSKIDSDDFRIFIPLSDSNNSCFLVVAIQMLLNIPEIRSDLINAMDSNLIKDVCSIIPNDSDGCENALYKIMNETVPGSDVLDVVLSLFNILHDSIEYNSNDEKKREEHDIMKSLNYSKIAIYNILNKKFNYCINNRNNYFNTESVYAYLYNMMCLFYRLCPAYNNQKVEIRGKRVIKEENYSSYQVNYTLTPEIDSVCIEIPNDKNPEIRIVNDSIKLDQMLNGISLYSDALDTSNYFFSVYYVDNQEQIRKPVWYPGFNQFHKLSVLKRYIHMHYNKPEDMIHLFLYNRINKTWSYDAPSETKTIKDVLAASCIPVFYYIPETFRLNNNTPSFLFVQFQNTKERKNLNSLPLPLFLSKLQVPLLKKIFTEENKNPDYTACIVDPMKLDNHVPYTYKYTSETNNSIYSTLLINDCNNLFYPDSNNIEFAQTANSINSTENNNTESVVFYVKKPELHRYYTIRGECDMKTNTSTIKTFELNKNSYYVVNSIALNINNNHYMGKLFFNPRNGVEPSEYFCNGIVKTDTNHTLRHEENVEMYECVVICSTPDNIEYNMPIIVQACNLLCEDGSAYIADAWR